MDFRACIDELEKLGAVSDTQAMSALNRLDTLERNKTTPQRVARYAAIGGVTAPAIAGIGHLIEGTKPARGFRSIASLAAKGALTAGAIPLVQQHFDRRGEEKTLRKYLKEHGAE